MLNVERIAAAPIGIKSRVHLEFDNYLYSASPPMFSMASLLIPQQIDYFSGKLFGQSPPREIPQETKVSYTNAPSKPCVEQREKNQVKNQKRVFFADEIGKQLIEVRAFSREDADFLSVNDVRDFHRGTTLNGTKSLFDICPSLRTILPKFNNLLPSYKPDFVQPISNFMSVTEELEKNCVSLEYANLTNDEKSRTPTLTGKLLVKRQGIEKVFLRCTCNNWKTHVDVEANRVVGNLSREYERFSFSIELFRLRFLSQEENEANYGNKYPDSVEFAVCCQCSSNLQFWDNNFGSNYKFSRQHA